MMTISDNPHRDAHPAASSNAAQLREARLRTELAETKAALQAIRQSRTWRFAKSLHGFVDDRPWLRQYLRQCANLLRSRTNRRADPRQQASREDLQAVLSSGLFDAAWYAARYPDAPRDADAAARHYLAGAGDTPRDPGPHFDAAWYAATNPEAADTNPLLHYLRRGRHRLRHPSPAAQHSAEQARRRALGTDLPVPQVRLAIGLAGPTTTDVLARMVRSARLAAERAGVDGDCEVLWLAQPGIVAPAGVWVVTAPQATTTGASPTDMTLPASHNLLLQQAADGGAVLYLAADPRGIFDPECLAALVRMSAAADHAALIAATDFPQENPKTYDTLTFDTGWTGGSCLLIPLALAADLGGCEPHLARFWQVDLSWRARQAGFAVKICPTALYHAGPDAAFTRDWVDDQALGAGYLLAQLWNRQAAAATLRAAILRRNGTLPDPAALRPQGQPRQRDPAIADFAHGFGFAPCRW
jgi:hypothetical protein